MAEKSRSLSYFLFVCALLSGVIFYGCGGGGGTSSSSVPLQISGNVTSIIPLAGMRAESTLSPDLRAAGNLAGVVVYLENYYEQYSTLSDADGKFLLSGIPAGSHYLVAMKKLATYTVKVRSSEAVSVSESRPAVQAATMALQSATATASGRLVDASGNGIPNGRMTVWGQPFWTDSNGYYETWPMPVNITAPVIVAVPGYQPTEIEVKFTENPPFIVQTIVNTSSTNRPPTCSLAASKYSVSPGTPVALSATASDPDQQLSNTNYSWSITGNIGTFSGSIADLRVTWVAPGESAVATITFTVTDDAGVKSQSSVQIVVGTGIYEPNVAPTVSAISSDLATPIFTGATGLLSVVATDSNGDLLYYKWSGEGSFTSSTSSSTYWTTPTIDATRTVTVTLVVDDRKGGMATATRDFVISYVENDPPYTPQIVSPLAGQLVLPGQSVNFVGSATDPQDGVLTGAAMSWYLNGNLFRQGSANFNYSVPSTPGTYSVRLQATDRYNVSASTTISIRINSAPTVSITTPTNGATLAVGSPITFTATANDVEGVIPSASYTWTFPGSAGVKTGNPHVLAGGSLPEGSNEIKVSVTDSIGVGATATINITIENSGPTMQIVSPTALAIAKDTLVNIIGSGTDNVTKVALPAASMTWKLYDGLATTTIMTGDDNFDYTVTRVSPHVLTLTGSDKNGKTTSVSHRFNVNTNPTVAINTPASGTRYNLGAEIAFRATVTDSAGEDAFLNASWSSSINGYIGIGSAGIDLKYSNLSSGSHVITCQGINSRSGLSASTGTMILVNTLPVGTLTFNVTNQYATAPDNVPVFMSNDSAMNITMTMTSFDAEFNGEVPGANIKWFFQDGNTEVPFGTGKTVTQLFPLGQATVTVRIYDSFYPTFEDQASATYRAGFYVWQNRLLNVAESDLKYIHMAPGSKYYLTRSTGGAASDSQMIKEYSYVDGVNPYLDFEKDYSLVATFTFTTASAAVIYDGQILALGTGLDTNHYLCSNPASPTIYTFVGMNNSTSVAVHLGADKTIGYLTVGNTNLVKFNPASMLLEETITEAGGNNFTGLARVRTLAGTDLVGKVFVADKTTNRVIRYLDYSLGNPVVVNASSPIDMAISGNYLLTLEIDGRIGVYYVSGTENTFIMRFGGTVANGAFSQATGICCSGKDLFLLEPASDQVRLIRSGMDNWLK